jgi:anti-anti-sigma regulatory factor
MTSPRAVLDVVPHRAVDLALVDALCRTLLAARRRGLDVRVRTADPRLRELLALTGLGELLGAPSGQPQRQSEAGEDGIAEEGVDVRDAPA